MIVKRNLLVGVFRWGPGEGKSDNTIYYVNFAPPDPQEPWLEGMAYALSRWSRGSYVSIILPQQAGLNKTRLPPGRFPKT